MPLVKIRKANASSLFESFDVLPTWENLSTKIANVFHIPKNNVGVAYIDKATESITVVDDEQGLKQYYSSLDQSGEVKFVVQDMQNPDPPTTIASTWSAEPNLSSLSDDTFTLFCCVLGTLALFSISVEKDKTVDNFKLQVNEKLKRKDPGHQLDLWQLKSPIRTSEVHVLRDMQRPEDTNCIKLDPGLNLEEYFSSPPRAHIHIVVQLPIDERIEPSRKRLRSPTVGEANAPKKMRTGAHTRSWAVDGAIPDGMHHYCLDLADQSQTKVLLDAVGRGEFVTLSGARASGKTTRLFRLRELLEDQGYYCLYFSIKFVSQSKTFDTFWARLGDALRVSTKGSVSVSSPETFYDAFAKEEWDQPVVMLIDELSALSLAPSEIRDSFLVALRQVKQDKRTYAITSVIAAGTFSVMHLNTTNPQLPPFNVMSVVRNPNFTLDETRQLFNMFQRDQSIVIESAVINDIWEISNGHPGTVCLCGKIVSNNLNSLFEYETSTVLFSKWQEQELYSEISSYNTFHRMIGSLLRHEALAAVNLYRYRFAGCFEEIQIHPADEELADFLTSEGVLLRPAYELKYRVASPLIDALIRLKVIPKQFHDAPLVPAKEISRNHLRILDIPFLLAECLKCFDKELM